MRLLGLVFFLISCQLSPASAQTQVQFTPNPKLLISWEEFVKSGCAKNSSFAEMIVRSDLPHFFFGGNAMLVANGGNSLKEVVLETFATGKFADVAGHSDTLRYGDGLAILR